MNGSPAIETEASAAASGPSAQRAPVRRMDPAGVARDLARPRRTCGLAQLQYVNCRKSRGGLIQIKPAALFEDLPFFETEGWFNERKKLKSASQKLA
jgi:hypothetical protein